MRKQIQRGSVVTGALAVGVILGVAGASGPDVIVGDLPSVAHYGAVGGIRAYAVGTTSCNIGDQDLLWIAGNNQHPVIGQSMFRIADGRIDQIGISWLKHGFTALTQNLCGQCNGHGGAVLGVGCSDPYGAGLNGSQGGLGPRFEVNPFTGVFNYPFSNPEGSTGNAVFKRIQVPQADLDVPGAIFFVEGQYVTADDAQAGNGYNNASYRRINKNGDYSMTTTGSTARMKPGIYAWKDHGLGVNQPDPDVTVITADAVGDGRFFIAYKVVDNQDGTYTYTYAIQNLNCDRSGGAFRIPLGSAAIATDLYFHAPDYHSGEPYDNADWVFQNNGESIEWHSPQTYAQNPDTRALRWGTMSTFRFTSDGAPVDGTLQIDLFEPGVGGDVTFTGPVPGDVGPAPVRIHQVDEIPDNVPPATPFAFNVQITAGDDTIVDGSTLLHYRTDGGAFVTAPLVSAGGDLYTATVPGAGCEETPEFYVSAEGVATGVVTEPDLGPLDPWSYVIGVPSTPFNDNCETDPGWVVTGNAIDGQWDRGTPAGGGDRGDPGVDADGSGQCWLTDNVDGNSDIDDGHTILTSPAIDGTAGGSTISYWRWFNNAAGAGAGEDVMVISISNGDGNWVELETVGPTGPGSTGGWNQASFLISDYVTPTATIKLRFNAADVNGASVVEAGVDGIRVDAFECDDCVADWVADGELNFFDVAGYLDAFSAQDPAADLNNDGVFDFFDVSDFLDAFSSGC
jgi:hypothetical protein